MNNVPMTETPKEAKSEPARAGTSRRILKLLTSRKEVRGERWALQAILLDSHRGSKAYVENYTAGRGAE